MNYQAKAIIGWLGLITLMVGAGGTPLAAPAAPVSKPALVKGAQRMGPFKPELYKGDLSRLPKQRSWQPGEAIKIIPKRNNHQGKGGHPQSPLHPPTTKGDPLIKPQAAMRSATPVRTLTDATHWRGQGFNGVYPPDPVGDVGERYYIQMVNSSYGSSFTIYDKTDGTLVAGPNAVKNLGSGDCAGGYGDPIVLYDSLAKRWFLSEFASSNNVLCVYVSRTSDPVTGGWYAYQFVSSLGFPDYPKYAVWPDAYYLTTNETSPGIYALEREAMLAGEAADMQFFSVSSLAGFGFQALLPSDLDGPIAPPVGAPNYLVRHRDDEVHNPANNDPQFDFIDIFEFSVNWEDESQSRLRGPISIAVADFDSDLCGLVSFSCFPQPGTTTRLDPLREVVMWRFPYRNFGDYQSLVGNFVVDATGKDQGAIRWFELRKTTGDWTLYQDGTYAPDAVHRWMGSLAMDGSGNIALAYSMTDGNSTYPSIAYTGRDAQDHLGAMTQGEHLIVAGSGSQKAGNRWGDYSSLNLDPVDDCTFWYTNEYAQANGSWDTAIARFRFDSCGAPGFFLSSPSALEQSLCAGSGLTPPIELQVLSLGGYQGEVRFSFDSLPAAFKGGFSPSALIPDGTAQASLQALADGTAGQYAFDILAQGLEVSEKRLPLKLDLYTATPVAPLLDLPGYGATDQPTQPEFSWAASDQAHSYLLQLATDEAFGTILYQASTQDTHHIPGVPLNHGTTYYWRVQAINPCGNGGVSASRRFETQVSYCSAPALAIPDNQPAGVSDQQQIAYQGVIQDLDVVVRIDHDWVGDLSLRLEHVDSGTQVQLMTNPGDAGDGYGCAGSDVDVILDDQAANAVATACAGSVPAIAGRLFPDQPLAGFAGQPLAANWRLSVSDSAEMDAGTLLEWCLLPRLAGISCDGDNVVLANRTIAAGEEVSCRVGNMEIRNLTLEGSLIIEKTGSVTLSPEVRSLSPGGTLIIRDRP